VEETPEIIYLVLPSASPIGQGGELSDQELDAVAGGGLAEATCEATESTYGCPQ
jgi:hypothetical protein